MSVIFYARVSTPDQAARDLSVPAQFKALDKLARDRGWRVAGTFQDASSGRGFRGRPGLLAALKLAEADRSIDTLAVHRVDRLARNTYQYLTIKGKLRSLGIQIVSVVEHLDPSPMGEFMENIMAAQAEFYSANLSLEVKKGLVERLSRGKWYGSVPIGYVSERGHVSLDPARAEQVRNIFELFASGEHTLATVADMVHRRGLVTKTGRKPTVTLLHRIIHNPFYMGIMRTTSGVYRGIHPPIVSKILFERCQEVLRQRRGGRGRGVVRQHLTFSLAGIVICPKCGILLTGERHVKPSGKEYRYYRCHRLGCGFSTRAETLETTITSTLLNWNLPVQMVPRLKLHIRQVKRRRNMETRERIRSLRAQRKTLIKKEQEAVLNYARGYMDGSTFDQTRIEIQETLRMTEWLLGSPEGLPHDEQNDLYLLNVMENFSSSIQSDDEVTRRQVLQEVVARVHISSTGEPNIELRRHWHALLQGKRSQKNLVFDGAGKSISLTE